MGIVIVVVAEVEFSLSPLIRKFWSLKQKLFTGQVGTVQFSLC